MFQQHARVARTDDEHTSEQSTFTLQVTVDALTPGSENGRPNGRTNKARQKHPSLTWSIKTSLFVKENIASKEGSKLVNPCSLKDNGVQFEASGIQLRLERGQLLGLLSAQ